MIYNYFFVQRPVKNMLTFKSPINKIKYIVYINKISCLEKNS